MWRCVRVSLSHCLMCWLHLYIASVNALHDRGVTFLQDLSSLSASDKSYLVLGNQVQQITHSVTSSTPKGGLSGLVAAPLKIRGGRLQRPW